MPGIEHSHGGDMELAKMFIEWARSKGVVLHGIKVGDVSVSLESAYPTMDTRAKAKIDERTTDEKWADELGIELPGREEEGDDDR